MPVRIGHGYDVHRLAAGRRLLLGGVDIPFERGLDGHSDADVLLHALCDALLGSLSLGDIGMHFPDTDLRYKDSDSLELLKRVMGMVEERGYRVGNVDLTVIAERPKISAYIPQMKENIARTLRLDREQVSIKATTTEGLGFAGRGEGIAVHAVVLVEKT